MRSQKNVHEDWRFAVVPAAALAGCCGNNQKGRASACVRSATRGTRTLTLTGFSPSPRSQRREAGHGFPAPFSLRRLRRASDTPSPDGGEGEGRLALLLLPAAFGVLAALGLCDSGWGFLLKAWPCQVGQRLGQGTPFALNSFRRSSTLSVRPFLNFSVTGVL